MTKTQVLLTLERLIDQVRKDRQDALRAGAVSHYLDGKESGLTAAHMLVADIDA